MKEMASKASSFFDRNANPRSMRTDDESAVTYKDQAIKDMAGRYDDDDNDGYNVTSLNVCRLGSPHLRGLT
jgi:hypothetical protein